MPAETPKSPEGGILDYVNLKNFLKNKVPKVKNQRYFVII
jgi:hypothetical protein